MRRGSALRIPLLVLLTVSAGEMGLRWIYSEPYAYALLAERSRLGLAKYIFTGISTMPAALQAAEFNSLVSKATGRESSSWNMGLGRGFSPYHYFGLRKAEAAQPDFLKDSVVFIETRGGLPDNTRWDDKYISAGNAEITVPLMAREDMANLWAGAETLESKFRNTLFWLGRKSRLVIFRHRLREDILRAGTAQIKFWMLFFSGGEAPPVSEWSADLLAQRGIRPGFGLVLRYRRMMEGAIRKELSEPAPIRPWEGSFIESTVRAVHSAGGRVAFLELPLGPEWAAAYRSPRREEARRDFERLAGLWGTPLLKPRMNITEQDFPDLMHLRPTRASEFSRAAAEAWLGYVKGDGERIE